MKESLFAFMDLFINWRNIKEHTLIMLEINEDEILETIAVYIMEKRKNKALLITAYTLALIIMSRLFAWRGSLLSELFYRTLFLLLQRSYIGSLMSALFCPALFCM